MVAITRMGDFQGEQQRRLRIANYTIMADYKYVIHNQNTWYVSDNIFSSLNCHYRSVSLTNWTCMESGAYRPMFYMVSLASISTERCIIEQHRGQTTMLSVTRPSVNKQIIIVHARAQRSPGQVLDHVDNDTMCTIGLLSYAVAWYTLLTEY